MFKFKMLVGWIILSFTVVYAKEVKYGPTQIGDKIWNIAAQVVSDSSVTRYQVVMALLKANPQAFRIACHVNTLKVNQILRVPSLTEIQALHPRDARTAYQQQQQTWQAYLQHQRPIVCLSETQVEQPPVDVKISQPPPSQITPKLESFHSPSESVISKFFAEKTEIKTLPTPPFPSSFLHKQISLTILFVGVLLIMFLIGLMYWRYSHHYSFTLLQILHRYPLLALSSLFILGMSTILFNLYSLANQISETIATQDAKVYAESLEKFRAFYSAEIVARLKPLGVQISHDYKNLKGTIPFPATLSIDLSKELSQGGEGLQVRLFSDYPFPWRKKEGGPHDTFESDALQFIERHPTEMFTRFESVDNNFSLRFAQAVIMKESCVDCHNTHPDSPKKDWRIGDVRGIQEVIFPLERVKDDVRQGLVSTFVIMTFITSSVLGLLALVIRELRKSLQQVKTLANETEQVNKELSTTNIAYRRFLPFEFLNALKRESITHVQLGDHIELHMSVLFSDLRSFTTFSERMTPQENFHFLNNYLSQMGPSIRAHRGFIDKYIGDAIMALFQHEADDAVKAGIAMLKTLHEYNLTSTAAPIQMGIGIHTGFMMLGTIGEQHRMETTVISDAVNLASRLEGMTKLYGVSLLISEQTRAHLRDPGQFSMRMIDRVKAKGRKEPLTIFEVYDGDPDSLHQLKEATQSEFEQGIIEYQNRNFVSAKQYFITCFTLNPSDLAAQLYIERCEHYLKTGCDQEWDGITELNFK